MEKIKVTIYGRNYNLVTDAPPADIRRLAGKLEEKIIEFSALQTRSDEEMLTLVALNILNEADKDMLGVKRVIGELHKKVSALEAQVADVKRESEDALSESLTSATLEMSSMAHFQEEQNEQLRQKIEAYEAEIERLTKSREEELSKLNEGFDSASQEMASMAHFQEEQNEQMQQKLLSYEKEIERLSKDREAEIKTLREGFESAVKEMTHIAQNKESENTTLRNTLNTYETTFDNYVKLKEEEIVRLRDELESVMTECRILRERLSAATGGQLSL